MKIALPKPCPLVLFITLMVAAVLNGCLSREAGVIGSENASITGNTSIIEDASSENTSIIEDVTLEEAYALIVDNLSNADFIIIDVRTAEEYARGHIEDAINIDFYAEDFDEKLNELDRDKIYLIYCQSGNRSGKVLDRMETLGFKEVYNLLGGIAGWERINLPTVK